VFGKDYYPTLEQWPQAALHDDDEAQGSGNDTKQDGNERPIFLNSWLNGTEMSTVVCICDFIGTLGRLGEAARGNLLYW